jgi:hypothetical protein
MKNDELFFLHELETFENFGKEVEILENLYLSGAIYGKEHEVKFLALINEISKFNSLILNNLEK